MFTLTVKDEITPGLTGIVRALTHGMADKKAVNKIVARKAGGLTRDHLHDLADKRHRSGVDLNFYEDAADSVGTQDLGDAVEIRIDKTGVAQRYYGGEIRARNYSHLWIPIEGSEAEGRSAGEFDNLVPIISSLTNKGVALKDGDVLFALVESVDQEKDPSVLPTDTEYNEVSVEAVNDLIDSMLIKNPLTRPFARKFETGRNEKGQFTRTEK